MPTASWLGHQSEKWLACSQMYELCDSHWHHKPKSHGQGTGGQVQARTLHRSLVQARSVKLILVKNKQNEKTQHTHTCTHACAHMCTCTCACMCMHMCAHTHIHTHTPQKMQLFTFALFLTSWYMEGLAKVGMVNVLTFGLPCCSTTSCNAKKENGGPWVNRKCCSGILGSIQWPSTGWVLTDHRSGRMYLLTMQHTSL